MSIRSLLFVSFCIVYTLSGAQRLTVSGKITDGETKPVEGVSVLTLQGGNGTVSNKDGSFRIKVAKGDSLRFRHIQFNDLQLVITGDEYLDVKLEYRTVALKDIEVSDKAEKENITPKTEINTEAVRNLPSAFGEFNKILITLPGVASNNELSSAYSVRGGNFDENLVYVNDIPIYRPFLANAGRQEGLSFVNPDMVEDIDFYPGGWEPKYGDKLSSSLNIQYKEPNELEGSVSAGLLGGTAYTGGRFGSGSYLFGARHRDSRYLLNSLETKGQYFPTYTDVQGLLTFDLTSKQSSYINKTKLNWLVAYGRNRYSTEPTSQLTEFGTWQQNYQLETAFIGRELLNYDTFQSGLRLSHNFNNRLRSHLIMSGLITREQELFEVEGAYRLSDVSNQQSREERVVVRGIGSNYDYGRNQLSARLFTSENRWEVLVSPHLVLEGGAGASLQQIEDELNEYSFIDSADYVSLTYSAFNEVNLDAWQLTGYLQGTWYGKDSISALIAGARANFWTLNEELLISPRITYRYTPRWKTPTSFSFSTGFYQQPPFYRELRNYQGEINATRLAQKSIHFILGMRQGLTLWGRPFVFSSDVYYKYLYDVIPYDIDNVRIRFLSETANAFATGVDLRLNGEFIKGTQSWFSISYLQTKEDLENDGLGYVRRPTDQRLNLAIYFEDHMPIDPTIEVYLNLVFGSGYPFGPPQVSELRNIFQGDEYYRADLGLSKRFDLKFNQFFNKLWIRAEVLNALGADNTLSYTWIQDVNGNNFAIPNSLSARFLNLKIIIEL
ncbi:MAG: TonB-dependent receptor plug domain-containing protein [Cyclobacteriaceae bacterium]